MSSSLRVLAGVVGLLALVEFSSGVLQGYYAPLLTDIARHLGITDADVNWFEGAQFMLSAMFVPAFAKLGDMVGHKRMLVISSALTAASLLVLPFTDNFWVFLTAWAVSGAYTVWLPLEVALIWSRTRGHDGRPALTARAAGLLVAALETGAIVGALSGGILIDLLPYEVVLLVPAVLVAVCAVLVGLAIEESPDLTGGRLDTTGVVLVSLALLVFTGGLGLMRINGMLDPWSWLLVLAGVTLGAVFARHELRHPDPVIDVRMFRSPALAPVFLTAGLFGVSVLGAQAPLSTFARTNPAEVGYGLGTTGFATSLIIGIYLIAMITGALLYPVASRLVTPRLALAGAAVLVGLGFLLLLPLHMTYLQVTGNMAIVGLGSGALVAALPAAAAAAAPAGQTGVATGLTNSVKTVGGAIASCVFGIALHTGNTTHTAASFTGYVTVWVVCGVTALISAGLLLFVVPRAAFTAEASH